MKRVKSFFITLLPILATAFGAVLLSPEWAALVVYLKDGAIALGVPSVIVLVIGLFLAEAWKAWLNARTLAKAGMRSMDADEVEVSLY